ncbi:hypothetical protein [Tepidibacter formicigenes]|uniref:Uncharacterized protein n=1 Tax=Tepidibacter formicigenes DSM 15518 TaxID=1123349 RepID=A0A1M6QQ05_9FIRM|nr:hypothetical protein [Tepidibacter formicigenes]SHK22180.1 hypothetical protein SAMN02744037_01910 [Tepidibacter formicigenes DSM 15518]
MRGRSKKEALVFLGFFIGYSMLFVCIIRVSFFYGLKDIMKLEPFSNYLTTAIFFIMSGGFAFGEAEFTTDFLFDKVELKRE